MIKVKMFTKNENIKGLEIRGHAYYDEYGKDIVCAAVSMLAYNTIDTFTDILRLNDKIKFEVNNNIIKLKIEEELDSEQEHDSQLILKKFELGMKSLIKYYGDFIQLNYMEV